MADSLFESQKIFTGIVLFICFQELIKTQKEGILFATIFTGLIFGIYGLVEWWTGSTVNGSTLFSLSGHENLLSSLCFLFLPFCIYAFLEKKEQVKFLGLFTGFCLLLLILLVNTRSVYLAIIISSGFFFIIFAIQNQQAKLRNLIIGGFAGLILAGGIFLLFGNSLSEEDALSGTQTASLKERFLLWDNTEKLIAENPIIGIGSGNWQYNYSKFSVAAIDKANFYNIFFKRPHNDFLWVFAETGIIGFSILILIIFLIGKKALAYFFEKKNRKTLIFLSALIGLVIISFFSFPKERPTHICISVLILVFLIEDIPYFQSSKNKWSNWIITLLPLGLLFNLVIGYYRFAGEHYTQKSIQAQNQNNPGLAIENGKKALSMFYTSDPASTPVYSYIGWGYSAQNETKALLEVSEKAYFLSPFDYKVLSNYGFALMRVYENDLAKQVLIEAYRINPNYEPVIFNLSVLAYNSSNYPEALKWLEKIPDYHIKYSENLKRIQDKMSQ